MNLITKYLVCQDGLSDWVGKSASWLSPAMIAILLWEITNRYVLGTPTEWAHELSAMFYGTLCMLAGAYTLRHRGHVRSEVLYQLCSKRGRAALDLFTHSLALFVLAIFLELAWNFAWSSWESGEVSNKGSWQPVIYPFKAMMPLSIALIMLQILAEVVRDICTLFQIKIDDPREEEIEPLL